jgi:ABC-2 type transport system ATP-binding protein
VEVVESKEGDTRLRVDRGIDLGELATFARRNTDLVSFAYQPPTLSELFRQAVAG